MALAWLFAQSERLGLSVVPIPGTRSPERIRENAGAVHLRLPEAQLGRLDGVADLALGDRRLSFTPPEWISRERE